MTCKESIKWLENLKSDLGKGQFSELWHYEQALAETIELLQSKRLVELPCSVGETVHYITYYKNKYDYHYIINASFDILFQLFHEKEIGYVIYMTDDKSKAEAKLKELIKIENA